MSQKKLEFIISLFLLAHITKAQLQKDTTIISKYKIQLSFGSRTSLWALGIEKISSISKNIKFSSQINLNGGVQRHTLGIGKQGAYNPIFSKFCIQPFHLLIGKNLQFETGPSFGFSFFRYKNQKYPLDTTNNAYNSAFRDRLEVFYLTGLRYTFPKRQISMKLLIGAAYSTKIFNYNMSRFFGCFETGILYTFRKTVYKKKYYNENK